MLRKLSGKKIRGTTSILESMAIDSRSNIPNKVIAKEATRGLVRYDEIPSNIRNGEDLRKVLSNAIIGVLNGSLTAAQGFVIAYSSQRFINTFTIRK